MTVLTGKGSLSCIRIPTSSHSVYRLMPIHELGRKSGATATFSLVFRLFRQSDLFESLTDI